MDIDPAYTELIAKMDSLRTDVRRRALRKSLKAMGDLVKGAISERAPTQTNDPRRGNLAKYNTNLKDELRVQVRIQSDANAALYSDRVAVAFQKDAEHVARFVEYGHRNVRGKKGSAQTENGFTEANPFIRPAFDATKEAALEIFEETMVAEIQEAMNG